MSNFRNYLAFILTLVAFRTSAEAEQQVFLERFDQCKKVDDPWGGVDGAGHIKVPCGSQLMVNEAGAITTASFAPSIAVGDLNGDGLPDLVVADSVGFFWYWQNHGTKDAPKFTTPELMPIWLADPIPDYWNQQGLPAKNVVPRIQLIDYDGDGKLDLVVGNFEGKLFYVRNIGSTTVPVFRIPQNLDDITVPTHRDRQLWCNYLAPCLSDFTHSGRLDLLIGDGTYSANSVYLLTSRGANDQPTFTEDNCTGIIPGMGREHLVPQVVSWNNDGKPDLLFSESAGFLNLFLNQTPASTPDELKFDSGQHVSVGGVEHFPECFTATLTDITGNHMPSLIVANPDGSISLAANVGTSHDFKFGPPSPLTGQQSRAPILQPIGWSLDRGFGSPYDLLVCTNAHVEGDLDLPAESGVTNALKFYIEEPSPPNPTFKDRFYPTSDTRLIRRDSQCYLKAGVRYKLSFWIKTEDNIENVQCTFRRQQFIGNGQDYVPIEITKDVSSSETWDHYITSIEFESHSDEPNASVSFLFGLTFNGTGRLYLASVALEEEND